MILLDSIICIGMIVSYIPQYLRILSLRNSFGFSPNFFLLGSIGVVSTLSNLILLQFYVILDCFIHNNDPIECIANLFGIIEIFIQFFCFFFLFLLFLWFFPQPSSETTDNDSSDRLDDLVNNEMKSIWEKSKVNTFYSLIYTTGSVLLVSISLIYSSAESNTKIALVYGLISTFCGILQFFPQLVYTILTRKIGSLSIGTMLLQVPGSFILVFSLYSTPGSNWTSYVSYLISGLLQATLLTVCIYLSRVQDGHGTEEEELLHNDDAIDAIHDH